MLRFLAQGNPARSNTASQSIVYYEDGRAIQDFHKTSDSKYCMTQTIPPKGVPTIFDPPLHFHSSQAEVLTVRKGIMHYFVSTQSRSPDPTKPIIVRPGETVEIPMGAYHRFESADPDNALVFDILFDQDTREREHAFFRNIFGYMHDCEKAGFDPSVFQLLRILYDFDGPLAVPLPVPFLSPAVGRAVSWALCYLAGVLIGEYLLGYKGSYDEYYKQAAE